MQRTKRSELRTNVVNNDLKTLASELVGRMMLAAKLGYQYGTARDIYQALGYDITLNFDSYFSRYTRQDIAKAVIDRPVKATWQGELELVETEEEKKTPFEKSWDQLNRRLGLKTRLTRVDKLTGIGRYGILLLGLNDVRRQEDFERPVREGARKLLYVKPFSEKSAKIAKYESTPSNPRYGQPLFYDIEVADVSDNSIVKSKVVRVHHTRVIHIVDDNLESEVFGTPRLEVVYNRLMDIEKIVGGDAEMFWRGARPGYQGTVDKDFTLTKEVEDDLINQLDEFEHNLRRFLINSGIDLKALAQEIADPANHVDVQIQMLSAATGIPKRVLTGSERGELASTQDVGEWKTYVQSRREDHAEPRIIRPFVDRLIELGVLPEPKDFYRIDWLDLFSVSEKDRVEIGVRRANAIREYTTNPMAEAILPPDAFLEICLGLTTGQIELIRKLRDAGISEEQRSLMETVKDILVPAASTGGGNGQDQPGQVLEEL